jgi:DNA replication and repair protein RecF
LRLLNFNLENFRNIESANLVFESDRVFLIGPNGQGKTNLLEAIGMSSNLRSFRKSGMDGLVREECDQCRMFFRFSDGKGKDREILLSFRPKGEKSLVVDGEKLSKLGDFLGEFPSVALSSRDFRLVREGPSERRKWLDLLLSTSSTEYFTSVRRYHRALRERNALLKKGGGDRELDAFEQALIPSALLIQKMRIEAIPKLSGLLSKSYADLCAQQEDANLEYKPDLFLESEQEWAKRLVEERAKDRIMGNTRRGPHRDDFNFLMNGRDARSFASEGQHRGLVLALRLAEFFFIRQARDQIPLILADDVLGELDDERKANFKGLLPAEAQVFASGTSFPSPAEANKWETFRVSSGTFLKS